MRKVFLILTMAAPIVLGVATSAQAGSISISCPGDPDGRQFQLVTDPGSICRDFGPGNGILNSSNPTADFRNGTLRETWTLLDSSDNQAAGTDPFKNALNLMIWAGGQQGVFKINAAVWGTYDRIVLAFQSEDVGGLNPDWAAFELNPNMINAWGLISGSWSITPGDQSIGHANLYGRMGVDTTGDAAAVPEPMSLALLGAGLTIGARRLRRKQ